MNLPQKIFKRAREKGLFSSCVLTPCGIRLWSFHLNADDIIYVPEFETYRPREAVIDHIPEYKALWFLDAYDQEQYDGLLPQSFSTLKWIWTG